MNKRMMCALGALLLSAQISAVATAVDPIAFVEVALARGETEIHVPKGRHFIDLPTNRTAYLALTGVTGVTIDFGGGELVGRVRSRMLHLSACTNVTIRNVTIDYETLPFTQAVIEKVDTEGNWDVRVVPGYPCPSDAGGTGSEGNTWPLQAYDRETLELKNPMRFRDDVRIVKTGTDTYHVTGGIDRRGDVGDIAVWSVKDITRPVAGSASWLEDCADCTLEGVTVYATPHGVGFMDIAGSANTYRRCVLDRRPPETDLVQRGLRRLRSGNHDAFNCRGGVRGFRVIDCTARYHCDDCVNVSGWSPLSRIFRDNLSRFFTRPPKTLAEKYFLPVPKALWTFFRRHPNRPKTPFFTLFGRRRRSHATAPPRVPVRSRARSVPVVRLRTREAPSACRLPSVSSAVR